MTSSQAALFPEFPAFPFMSRLWVRVETAGGNAAGLEAYSMMSRCWGPASGRQSYVLCAHGGQHTRHPGAGGQRGPLG